jgi:hypothetical protein
MLTCLVMVKKRDLYERKDRVARQVTGSAGTAGMMAEVGESISFQVREA